jgi:hypothetical protein
MFAKKTSIYAIALQSFASQKLCGFLLGPGPIITRDVQEKQDSHKKHRVHMLTNE